jgi:ankyrin repeat protein
MSEARLFAAIATGDVDEVGRLLGGAPGLVGARNESGVQAVLFARYTGHQAIVDLLLEAGARPDIFTAAALGDATTVAALADADPERAGAFAGDGFTPLHLATFFGSEEVARLLLDRGVDVDPVARNAMRVTPLHSAAAGRHLGICALLLDHGADPNARQQDGFTPLHAAAQHGDAALAGLLLKHGADRTARTENGRDAATIASESGHAGLSERLGARA